ncbi:hypothetical protein AUP68_16139 [Ilyonectria robusta]
MLGRCQPAAPRPILPQPLPLDGRGPKRASTPPLAPPFRTQPPSLLCAMLTGQAQVQAQAPCKHTVRGKQTPVYHGHLRIPLRACGIKVASAGATMDNDNYTRTVVRRSVVRRAAPSCVYLATFDQPCKEATQTPGRSIAHTHSTRVQHNEAPP